MKEFDFDNKDIEWLCDGPCGDTLGRNSYVTMVTTSTGEVIQAEDGRVIDMEPQFKPEVEHLCFTCYSAKYKDPADALRVTLGVVANVVELLEDETNDDFYNPKQALEKLNKLVVYIAEVLPQYSEKEGVPVTAILAPQGCICPNIGTEKECTFDDVLCSKRPGFILRDLDEEEDRQERLTKWAEKRT